MLVSYPHAPALLVTALHKSPDQHWPSTVLHCHLTISGKTYLFPIGTKFPYPSPYSWWTNICKLEHIIRPFIMQFIIYSQFIHEKIVYASIIDTSIVSSVLLNFQFHNMSRWLCSSERISSYVHLEHISPITAMCICSYTYYMTIVNLPSDWG
jgi:hypothetical protein